MLPGEEIKVIDINSEYYGIPPSVLMDNAGTGLASFLEKKDQKNFLFFCGVGNNGGDGLVASRIISEKYNVVVFIVGKKSDIKTDISKKNFEKLKKTSAKIYDIDSKNEIETLLDDTDIVVDAMLGIGIKGEPREPYKTIIQKINNQENKIVVACDIPTGFQTSTQIKADYTITFHDQKNGMNAENCGEIHIVDIEVPEKAKHYVGPGEISVYYPRNKKESHKGDNGKTLIIGGGPFTGAPYLSSMASLKTGTDLSYVAAPSYAAEIISSYSPNLIVKPLTNKQRLVPTDLDLIEEFIKKIDTVAVGPGLGGHPETLKTVEYIITKCVKNNKNLVIDADAIQAVGNNPSIIKNSKTVLTPHAGEFKKLTGINLSYDLDQRTNEVQKWANEYNVTIFLKGPVDIITNGKQTKYNDIHNPSMTVGGTGDVLTGIIAALLSKNMSPFNASRTAAFINGEAGNLAFEKKSYGLLPTDILDEIPTVLIKYV